MQREDFTQEEWSMLQWMKYETVMTKSKAIKLIDDLEETIIELRDKIRDSNRLEKNSIYNKIANRQSQIKWATQFI